MFTNLKINIPLNTINNDLLITNIIQGIEEVKGDNVKLIDLREIENTVCDFFVLCSGTSNTQVDAIESSIRKQVSKAMKDKPWHVEGQENSKWVLMDYVNVVVHIFQKETREYYDIEGLWGDAKITEIETNY